MIIASFLVFFLAYNHPQTVQVDYNIASLITDQPAKRKSERINKLGSERVFELFECSPTDYSRH